MIIDKLEVEKSKENIEVIQNYVHKCESIIPSVSKHEYLGSITSSDSKNSPNIATKISKGRGIVNNIIHILENINLEEHLL